MNLIISSFTSPAGKRALITKCGICETPGTQTGSGSHEYKSYDALWDTGATNCVISKRVVQELGLHAVGMTKNITAGGTINANRYLIDIMLPNKVQVISVKATEAELNGFDMLIGMDIIMRGDFSITHKDGKTKFSFQMPSTHDIDFVKEGKERNAQQNKMLVNGKVPGRNDPCPCGSGKKYKNCHGKNR
ncbi:MAG: SEC-C domain-containing protein [Bacteroidales bacterium]|nr:SEC-C domain-containing protein [Bacteroidales bacterium]